MVADPAHIDSRFLLDEAKAELIERVVGEFWPGQIDPAKLDAALAATVREARAKLLDALDLAELA